MSTTTHEPTHETVGQRIRRLRLDRGLSMRDLAGDDYTFAYISRLESGDRTASLTALISFAHRLGVSALYLLTGQDGDCPFCGRTA